LRALEEHVGARLVDLMLVHQCPVPQASTPETAVRVTGNGHETPMVAEDVADPETPGRHDSQKLADVLMRLLEERTGPLELAAAESAAVGDRVN
jgi:2-phospho-L-lactate transferase/gluconeogenesis factor (CofD/UPF0052 family)